jgi:transcriptional regulator with PAS, ATPase and Fis domain
MSRLRATTADLAEFLDHSIAPVYVLDDRRRIIYCNPACARWIGTKVADLLDQQCGFNSPSQPKGPAASASALCPPPKVFSGHALSGLVSCAGPDGQLRYRVGHFWPLDDGQDESAPVLAILDSRDCDGPESPAADPDAHLHQHVRRFRHEMGVRYRAQSLIGHSPRVVKARAQIEMAAAARANVFCIGPRGTGKNHVAKTIHYRQPEPGTLVPIACAILESNLSRATLRSLSLRQSASGEFKATLLLEDVDSLSADAHGDLQPLLNAGPSQVRVIATSCTPLDQLLGDGRLTPALACALSTITIELPTLAERLEDLPLLAQMFLEDCNATAGKQLGGFSPEALDALAAHPWPGNLDEFSVVVRESHERARFGQVELQDLPERIRWASESAVHPPRVDEPIVLEDVLANIEREFILRAFARAKGNKSKAAKLLGLTRPRLYRRLEQLGLEQAQDAQADDDSADTTI